MHWDSTERDGVGVLQLFGYLGRQDAHRFEGAVGWVRSRSTGPLVLDLSGLLGWSEEGEAAVVRAAGSPLAVCGLRDRPAPLLTTEDTLIRIYPDLRSALADLASMR
ncbi:STAS domain-containing protein [Streptomyces sp. M3]|uniref:STAS domain-containing protein n=1 Tax=Streptomyces sp. M3 TaxID=295102 RepID=UPI001F50FC27|nr:STAS domain-containing protein [Streptomyces sp. M3]